MRLKWKQVKQRFYMIGDGNSTSNLQYTQHEITVHIVAIVCMYFAFIDNCIRNSIQKCSQIYCICVNVAFIQEMNICLNETEYWYYILAESAPHSHTEHKSTRECIRPARKRCAESMDGVVQWKKNEFWDAIKPVRRLPVIMALNQLRATLLVVGMRLAAAELRMKRLVLSWSSDIRYFPLSVDKVVGTDKRAGALWTRIK